MKNYQTMFIKNHHEKYLFSVNPWGGGRYMMMIFFVELFLFLISNSNKRLKIHVAYEKYKNKTLFYVGEIFHLHEMGWDGMRWEERARKRKRPSDTTKIRGIHLSRNSCRLVQTSDWSIAFGVLDNNRMLFCNFHYFFFIY